VHKTTEQMAERFELEEISAEGLQRLFRPRLTCHP
jgi:hypothetical protein